MSSHQLHPAFQELFFFSTNNDRAIAPNDVYKHHRKLYGQCIIYVPSYSQNFLGLLLFSFLFSFKDWSPVLLFSHSKAICFASFVLYLPLKTLLPAPQMYHCSSVGFSEHHCEEWRTQSKLCMPLLQFCRLNMKFKPFWCSAQSLWFGTCHNKKRLTTQILGHCLFRNSFSFYQLAVRTATTLPA